jgi:hypothetical protein
MTDLIKSVKGPKKEVSNPEMQMTLNEDTKEARHKSKNILKNQEQPL